MNKKEDLNGPHQGGIGRENFIQHGINNYSKGAENETDADEGRMKNGTIANDWENLDHTNKASEQQHEKE